MMMPSLRYALTLFTMIVPPTLALVNEALANPLCGLNSVFCYYSVGTIASTDSSKSCSELYSNASYDLIRGAFAVGFQTPPGGGATQGAAAVAAVDHYRVAGVSPGAPLVFSAELDVSLRAYGQDCQSIGNAIASSASATLREGDSNQSSASITTPVICSTRSCCAQATYLNKTLRVAVTRLAGELFTLRFDLASSGRGSGQGSGQLHFSGLPSGAFVVSCQGYRQDFATAAKGRSWGGLKLLYR